MTVSGPPDGDTAPAPGPAAQQPAPTPQPVLSPLTASAIFLVVTINAGGEAVVSDLLGDLSGLQRSVGFRIPEGRLACVTGIGSAAWDRLFLGRRPRELHEFEPLKGAKHQAPATPGDLLFHVRANRMDLCFEYIAQVMARLAGSVTVQDEVHGFRYFDERDLIGFVDGTENPTGQAARTAALVSDEDPEFAGGSYVVIQKYVHDISAWHKLSTEEQEKVIGRSKLSDIEMPDDIKPANSHVALNTIIDPDGTQRQIVRANMPFGSPGRAEFGTYYIAYSATPAVTMRMLANMFIGNPPGNHDRILDFSTAITGCMFFVPPVDFLDDPPDLPGPPGPPDPPDPPDPPSQRDGSLRIGSLQRSAQQ